MSKRISAGKFVVREDPEQILAENEQVQARIRQRAFEISLNRGHAGREVEDWLAAESEIISVPPVELAEDNGAFLVRVPVAGIEPENIEVLTTSDQVLIKAAPIRPEPESAVIHLSEFKSAPLFRCLKFPEAVDTKSLKVQSQNGLLTITAPKATTVSNGEGAASSKPRRAAPRPKARRMAS
jgi:HSP20 family molecular chaperone IbpA